MTITVRNVQLFVHNIRNRMPFRYGIAEMTAVPHLFVQLECQINGEVFTGVSADSLIPKWFTKDPETSYDDDLADMFRVIEKAGELATHQTGADSIFDLWFKVYRAQQAWASGVGYPSLLWNFGVSLIERALIDALCRAENISFAQAVAQNRLGIRLEDIHPQLKGWSPADLLPVEPLPEINIRHTVGLSDYLTEAEIPAAERIDDGLPQSLEANIQAYGLRYFKIKINGRVETDVDRLCRIDALLNKSGIEDYCFTLDGNEQYHTVAEFKEFWELLTEEASCAMDLDKLLFVEQPFHRQEALTAQTGKDLKAWDARPLMIIDESDSALESMQTALESGYAGTSHKNCKGVFKSIANAGLLAYLREQDPTRELILSGEDLANLGPVALLQDLAVMSVLGIEHVERNGHQYFAGLSPFPEEVQQIMLDQHPDLYRQSDSFATLKITDGRVEVRSLQQAGFGSHAVFVPEKYFQPKKSWDFESLDI